MAANFLMEQQGWQQGYSWLPRQQLSFNSSKSVQKLSLIRKCLFIAKTASSDVDTDTKIWPNSDSGQGEF
jgi:hypothetical protein